MLLHVVAAVPAAVLVLVLGNLIYDVALPRHALAYALLGLWTIVLMAIAARWFRWE